MFHKLNLCPSKIMYTFYNIYKDEFKMIDILYYVLCKTMHLQAEEILEICNIISSSTLQF